MIVVVVVGGVFLSVTGCEALFADLGHFGLWPVRASWFFVVLPSVIVNYLGQGAMLIHYPQAVENPFEQITNFSFLFNKIKLIFKIDFIVHYQNGPIGQWLFLQQLPQVCLFICENQN